MWTKQEEWFTEYEKNYGEQSITATKQKRQKRKLIASENVKTSEDLTRKEQAARYSSGNRKSTYADIARQPEQETRKDVQRKRYPLNSGIENNQRFENSEWEIVRGRRGRGKRTR